ncbi:MAG TPA: hypothetical protein VEW46_18145 [Pyrinomonadaceae bacterium]|nr:hypothetical protein [Pyrinomonadaceae bacterium]
MRPLSAAQLLDAWEQGLSEPACRRALPLLAAASQDNSTESVATLSIGERDRWLLILREWTFGPQLASVASCSECSEQLEWTVNTSDLCTTKRAELPGELSLELDHYCVTFRVPNSLDLAAVADCTEAETARCSLLERCIVAANLEGQEIASSDLPEPVVKALINRLGDADPQADMQVELECPVCGHSWRALFDIESFFWSEINAWAQRILLEVHTLARAYGWREKDILNLSPWRRHFYLGLVGG